MEILFCANVRETIVKTVSKTCAYGSEEWDE